MELLVYVRTEARTPEQKKVWKKRFKKLKFARVRAEDNWQIIMELPAEHEEQILQLEDEQFRVERILE